MLKKYVCLTKVFCNNKSEKNIFYYEAKAYFCYCFYVFFLCFNFKSQAVLAGNTLYLSGQIGVDPVTLQLVPGGLVPETEQVSINVEELFPYTKIKV